MLSTFNVPSLKPFKSDSFLEEEVAVTTFSIHCQYPDKKGPENDFAIPMVLRYWGHAHVEQYTSAQDLLHSQHLLLISLFGNPSESALSLLWSCRSPLCLAMSGRALITTCVPGTKLLCSLTVMQVILLSLKRSDDNITPQSYRVGLCMIYDTNMWNSVPCPMLGPC